MSVVREKYEGKTEYTDNNQFQNKSVSNDLRIVLIVLFFPFYLLEQLGKLFIACIKYLKVNLIRK